MLRKEISISTALLALLYFLAYAFNSGIANFYGFPKTLISIGIGEIVRSSVLLLGFLFSLAALLHLDTKGEKISPGGWILFFIASVGISFGGFYVWGGNNYLFQTNMKDVFSYSLAIGLGALIGLNSIFSLIRNKFQFKSKTSVVLILGMLILLPESIGWATSYAFEKRLFYSSDNKAYLLASYEGKYILGRCSNNKAEYLWIAHVYGDIKPVSEQATYEIKSCFLTSSKADKK